MRALDRTDLSSFNRIDWRRSTEKLGSVVSERTGREWEFSPEFDDDGSVGFSARAGGSDPSDSNEQTELLKTDRAVINEVFESFDWIVYR